MDRQDDEKNPSSSSHGNRKRKSNRVNEPDLKPVLKQHKMANSEDDEVSQAINMDSDSESSDSDREMDQPSLLEQLKSILDSYQDAQIIRELIQNADDANASEMQIIYVNDSKEKSPGELQSGCYSEYFRSPALCVYNDEVFNGKDWTYIRSIYRSGKRENAMKVGRFGLGFKSVFHMTDNPVIISGDQILVIDPFRTKKKLGKDCHTLKFKKLCKSVQRKRNYREALVAMKALFGHCGFTKESLKDRYHGTLFWFPFRRSPSELSSKVFEHSDVTELVSMLKKDAHCLPLFLKNISHISFCEKGTCSTSFSVKRIALDNEEKISFNLNLAACKGKLPDEDLKAILPVIVTVKDGEIVKKQRWVLCSYIKGTDGLSKELTVLIENKQLSYSPFVGIAVPVDSTPDIEFRGQVFCFLPLPATSENYTGLPVHINGFFALSQDRHHVKWPTDDQTYREDAQTWNRLLCEEVIAEAYTYTLEYMKGFTVREQRIESDNLVYKTLPSQTNILSNWGSIADPLFRNLQDRDIFYTKNNSGKWIQAKDAVFAVLIWNCDAITHRQTEQVIFNLLLESGCNVVNAPLHVAESFPDVQRVTPQYLRDVMRENPIYTSLSSKDKLLLLQFVLADQQYSDLGNLQLLPLEDDTFCLFNGKDPKYLCTEDEMKMFPGIEQNFVKLFIPKTTRNYMNEIQKEASSRHATNCLRRINKENFPSLLKKTLSANGKYSDCFNICTNHITMQWLDRIWKYIGQHFDTLETFEHMFLVPVRIKSKSSRILDMMSLKGKYVVAMCGGTETLGQNMRNALSKLKITVINHIPKGDSYDALMGAYCKYPNIKDVLDLLEGTDDVHLTICHFNERSCLEEKKALLEFLSKDPHKGNPTVDDMLRQLDIFPETSDVNNTSQYTSINKNGKIACRNLIPVKYPFPLLHLESSQKILAERLGASEISECKLVEEILNVIIRGSDEYSSSSIEKFMIHLLKHLNEIKGDHDTILYLGSRIKFIDVSSAIGDTIVESIRHFFDHTNRNLQELFHFNETKFVPSRYRKLKLKSALRKFGLKSEEDVEIDDICNVVEILDRKCRQQKATDKENLRKCSQQAMKLLEKIITQSADSFDALGLTKYRWIAYLSDRPSHYPSVLPWYGQQFESILCSPQDVVSTKHQSLSASVKCIMETSFYPRLAEIYGWDTPPGVEICLLQLKALREIFCIRQKATLMHIVKAIYLQLHESIVTSRVEELTSEFFVCTQEGFHHAEKVFVSFPTNENICLEPFLYKLPVEFSEFSELFVLHGSIAELTVSSMKSILMTIKRTTTTSTATRDRKMVKDILECIVSMKDDEEILDDVLVPVKSNNASFDLYPVKDCTFFDSDSSWLHNSEVGSTIRSVHSDISAELAESLGIQSFTQRFMSEGGTEEIYSACGQSEPLTTRLNNILENYPDGLAVFKELVQNAADAGAQRIHFLYDERQNKDARSGLVDVNMAECQGPALWAYNDVQFTESDFQNIIKLGDGTKKSTKHKIGKFGLGFCAVYNLTDVPSFVSGNSLVIFDPHTTYLGKAIKDKSSPGIRLTFTEKSSGILKMMRNQFRPYNNIFGCDLSGHTFPPKFNGTLFRFPLRTKHQAIKSAIKNTPYSRDEMISLFHLFKNCAGDMLTFTQNMKEMKLFHLPEESLSPARDIKAIFSIDKKVVKINPLFESPAGIHVMREVEKAFKRNKTFEYHELLSVKMCMPKSTLLDVRKPFTNSSKWFVAWASGNGNQLLEHACRLESEGALPLGSVAVFLENSKLTAVPFPHKEKLLGFYNTSHFFCFLPLPSKCKLPVHINGCFAVSSDRKGLVKGTSDEKGETKNQIWNRMVMSDAVCNAYLSMLTCLDKFGTSPEKYATLWPISNSDAERESYLSNAFFEKITSGDYEVFYTTDGRRATFRESVFLDHDFRHDKTVGDYAFDVFQNKFCGKNIPMDMSKDVYQQFCTAGCKEKLDQQVISVEKFFEKLFFPNINQINEEKRDALVMFILKNRRLHLQQLLKLTPCIPVRQDRRLRFPNELVRPKSEVSHLFFESDGRFPSDSNQPFCKEKILDVLVQLGMMDRTMSDQVVVERTKSIAELPDHKAALHRCRKLLEYLCREHNHEKIFGDLSSIAFLPYLKKPSDWPLPWRTECSTNMKVMFFPPNKMFLPTHVKRIACSQPIVDVEEFDRNIKVGKVLQLLGVRQEILKIDVEAQLLAISQVHYKTLTVKQKTRLHSICNSVYQYLNNSPETLTRQYQNLPIILMSDCLIPPKKATMETFDGIDCSPAIYQLGTADVAKYTNFLELVGVQKTLSHKNVLSALEQIKMDNKETILSVRSVELTVKLLELLTAMCERSGMMLSSTEKSQIYVPDDLNVLRLTDELCVDDGYQLKRQDYMHFVNKKVSVGIIKSLGIKSKRVKHLNSIKGSMPFGQKEELVTRLRGILEEYPRDETILYELLQNADDAGSSEIMFFQDMRQHETTKGIFGNKWSEIQGPALCVFNDSCFSVEDLEGICKLGKGSKSHDPLKTGQFGVGFNAVYHLTDVPSFISKGPTTPNNGTFCVFDPHCYFCQANDNNPGLQIPDLRELEESYPGVFECYLQKELPRQKGTWFRFPLRNKNMAPSSRICNKPMDIGTLNELFQHFKFNMKKCLLFLRNIRKISLFEIDEGGNIKINHEVESSLDENDESNLKEFTNNCNTCTKALYDRSVLVEKIEYRKCIYNMTIQETLHQPEHWIVAQTFGFDTGTKIPEIVRLAFQCGDMILSPKGAVALLNVSRNIQSTSNKGKQGGQAFCFLPLPLKTGLPIHVNGHFALNQTRGNMWDKTYKGDWNKLLFSTVVSNSYIMAIEHLRDNLLENDINREGSTVVNVKSRLENYHNAFPRYEDGKTDLIKGMITSFFSTLYEKESTVFPVISPNATSLWWVALQQRSQAFPACFDNLIEQFLYSTQLIKPRPQSDSSFIIGKKEEDLERATNDARCLSSVLKGIGMKLLESPLWIHESMRQALQQPNSLNFSQLALIDHLVNPSHVIQFLKIGKTSPDACRLNDVHRKVTDTPIKSIDNVNRLLRYCLKDEDDFHEHKDQLPLLVTNDAILRCFSSTRPAILSPFCDLLPKSANKFVHSGMVNVLTMLPLKKCQCLKSLDQDSFTQMLSENFDKEALSGDRPIPWDKRMLSVKWIETLWQYLDSLESIDIDVMENWCLIPGKLKTTGSLRRNDVLVPFDRSFILLNCWSFQDDDLRNVLMSLNVPTMHSCTNSAKLRGLVASQKDPVRLVQCLHYHRDNLKNLTVEHGEMILSYLSQMETIEKLKKPPFSVQMIKDLTLFRTVNGINVSLQRDAMRILIVKEPSELVKDGIESWSDNYQCTLLEENKYALPLMSYLNCSETVSVSELYCKHVLPNFCHLERAHHLIHLEYVRNMLRDTPDCPFKKVLRTSEFIFHDGCLKRADSFYSPHNRLCKRMCDESMLPPDPFGCKEWKTLMVSAGMKEIVSADLFVQFAKKIESGGQSEGMTKNIREQSKEIATYLFETKELYNNPVFLEQIKNIRFVEPDCVNPAYQQIYSQFGCEGLITFCGSVHSSITELVWSTTPILPDYIMRNVNNGLGILKEPPLVNVLSHTHNVFDSMNKILHEKKTETRDVHSGNVFDKLITTIYKYLQGHCLSNRETKQMLSETPIVHIMEKGLFVTARQVSISFDGKKPIPPHLFQIPLCYGPYQKLFQFLGTTGSVTLSQYADVLYRIQCEVKSNMLDPDHLEDVKTALHDLMLLLEEKEVPDIETSMADVESLYLPTCDKRLVKSTDLVFVDKNKLKKRVMRCNDHNLQFIHSLKACHNRENIIMKLPNHLKPRVLSSIVQEVLISDSNIANDTKVDELGAFLASERFLNVIKVFGKFSDEDFDRYHQQLLNIQLISLTEIKTILTIDGRYISDTEAGQDCFYTTKDGVQKLYFADNTHEISTWLKDIGGELFGTLSDCLDQKISPEKIREVLGFLDDPVRFRKYCETHFEEEESEKDILFSYFPGNLVPLGLHELLQNEISLLKTGDLVVYEKFDPTVEGHQHALMSNAIYIFVRILKIVPQDSQTNHLLQKYEVSFGHGRNEVVMGLRLYKVVYPEVTTSTELVVHQFGQDSFTPLNRNNIFHEIIFTLSKAWQLDTADRKRVMRRLLLIWHPDKNLIKGDLHQGFAKEVTQFIFDICRRLDEGEDFDTPIAGDRREPRRRRNYDGWSYGERSTDWVVFGDQVSSMYRQSREHGEQRQKDDPKNPQRAEGIRWLRQASMDFKCGMNSLELNKGTLGGDNLDKVDYNWVCYMFHQACEKACKGYVYSIDAKKVQRYHNLRSIIPWSAGNEQLIQWLDEIETIAGSYFKMRYPDVLDYPRIPGDSYSKEQANKMMKLTTKVMEEIEDKM
ncbi:sacsin-like [Ylistrum balloti]|uniref:sacsin-like n=1 Tax=Ylistrum balloti TaxID=509963 RepID=UPI002905C69E|nr:sacsin-like [Ylistrum balloti]